MSKKVEKAKLHHKTGLVHLMSGKHETGGGHGRAVVERDMAC